MKKRFAKWFSVLVVGTMILSGGVALAADADFDNYTVESIDPAGTVINLFDYWAAYDRDAPDYVTYDETIDQAGINEGHVFKFGSGMGDDSNEFTGGSINAWTKSENPHTGIVRNVLGPDGYPQLNDGCRANVQSKHPNGNVLFSREYNTDNETEKSLAYLFNTNDGAGKRAFSNVGGLLQVDKDGYYYYDSAENYAWFDETAKKFKLYNTWGVQAGGASKSNGQFFPFNGPDDVFELDTSTELKQREEVTSTSENINHYFGLTMSTRFVQKNDGKTYNDNEPITYEFSGDDDVWVFIDDVLVADLGGIHDKASLSINFSTGVIKINNKQTGTIRSVFNNVEQTSEWGDGYTENTFANDTYHTLKFFYLERGNTDSNMSLKYNLMPIPESRITKVDQNGAPMTGVGFELYLADKDGEYVDSVDPIYSGTTGADGTLRILDDAGLPLTFKEFYEEYNNTKDFVLKEDVPEGYRGSPKTYLEYEPETGLILADGYWDTGSYASPQVTTTATNVLYKDTGGVPGDEIIDLTKVEDLEDIEIFAVLFKRLDMNEPYYDEDNWAPISGSIEKGWTVYDNSGVSMLERVSQANTANMNAGIDNCFKLTSGGAFQVTIEDLPGDIKSYYWYLDQQQNGDVNSARYTANYYLMTKSDEPVRLYTDKFEREFSTNVYVSNIKDQLVVEKTNEAGEKMGGATFSLYKADDVSEEDIIDENGTVNLDTLNNSDIAPYDTGTTATLTGTEGDTTAGISGDGLLIFPTENGRPLMKGNYYLIETKSGSENYSVNPKAVKVVVDESGVHVDAGTENDGISTRLDVGHVLKSMFRFVPDTGIDATLNNIKTRLLTAESYPSEGWEESPGHGQEGHLEYVGNYSGSGYYGVEYEPVEGTTPLDTTTSAGWSKLAIRQCLAHGGGTGTETESVLYTENGSLRQDLRDQDISHLFSTITYVTVENRPDIKVTKEWKDNNNEHKNRPKSVTVKLLADGVDTENTLVLNEGNNWTGNFTNIPVKNDGTPVEYTIKEEEVAGYDSKITGNVATGFTITNTLKTVNISGAKTWDDNDNQDGKRPDSITIRLRADSEAVSEIEVTPDENGDWKWTFVGLPKYADGEEITYTIEEDAVTGYTTTYDGYDVTNTYTPGKTSVTVIKAWNDGNNQDGKRPNRVTVELLAGGEKTGNKLELSEGNSWTGSFTGLDEYSDGEEIVYTIEEEDVDGYTSAITGNASEGFTITNTYTPETISISGTKIWVDNNNRAEKRPDSISIRLLADGKELSDKRTTVEPDADGNWQWTFDGLPKYSDGKEIVYSVAEEKVPNYTAKVNGFNITNTYSPDTPVGPDDPDDPPVGPVDPDDPDDPDDPPVGPVDPDDPDDPDDPPVGPVDPDDPDDPDDPPVGPVDPDDPDYPTFPEGPDEPGIPGYNGKVDDAVKTGDETMIGLWLALMGIGAAGTLAGIFSRRKKEEKN